MRKTFSIILLALIGGVFLFIALKRDRKQYVAVVGGQKIFSQDFKDRYQNYLFNVSSRDNILLRQKIIDNMINEKIIFEDLRRQGFDRDEEYRTKLDEIAKQSLLDRYARSISTDTLSVSEQELWKEFRVFNSKVAARYLYAKTEEGAWKMKELLERGATFELLAKDVFEDPGLANNGGYLGYFGWGEMEPALEEAAFSLPVGTISDPIRLKIGYAIVKVENRVEQPLASEYDFARSKEKLSRAIIDKKVVQLVKNAVDDIGRDLGPRFNDRAVQEVFDRWSYLVDNSQLRTPPEQESDTWAHLSAMPIVTFQQSSWTVKDFLEKVRHTTQWQRKRVKTVDDVKDVCIGLATREILLKRAQEVGFEDDPEVIAQIDRVREEYLLKRWAQSVRDTVGQHGWDEKILRTHYEQNKTQYAYPSEVNVGEILVRTESEAGALVTKVRKGESFTDLARKYSIRLWAAKRGGELGFGTKATYGILGEKIFAARIGQVLGPERVDPYFGVFKILAKREGKPKTFEETKEEIIEELKFVRKQEVFKQAIANLRSRCTINIDHEVLANIMLD